jgi:arylsulfatase A-like enzyme
MPIRRVLPALLLLAAAAPPQEERPNIVFILADDLGATDLGCTGSRFYETPNLDRLAAQGLRFTTAYSACTVCSPTRASLLTGKSPARLHLTDWIAGHARPKAKLRVPAWTQHLGPEQLTIAKALKQMGYATASMGKWHLGGEEFRPGVHGFDVNLAGGHQGQPPSYFSPYRLPTLPDGPRGEYLTDRLTDEAVKFIREPRNGPFFLYLPHFAVHTPLQAKQDLVEAFKGKVDAASPQKNVVYAAMLRSLDESVGRVVKALEESGKAAKTLIVFTSDNGGLLPVTSNLGLRAGKGSAYEGGVRVPLIAAWPGRIAAGRTVDVPVITTDWFPTLLDVAGVRRDGLPGIDGVSLEPLLRGGTSLEGRALHWHYPHYHPGGATPHGAIREGPWRLVEFFEDDRVELYHLVDDPEEKKDLAAERPEKAKELRAKLIQWRRATGAQMPTANPDYEAPKQ